MRQTSNDAATCDRDMHERVGAERFDHFDATDDVSCARRAWRQMLWTNADLDGASCREVAVHRHGAAAVQHDATPVHFSR